ncbi:MFS general substrate transporter [Peniophora sp. CONT]|nr:MFS general substrate transporter [Peniophora sp. CONT]
MSRNNSEERIGLLEEGQNVRTDTEEVGAAANAPTSAEPATKSFWEIAYIVAPMDPTISALGTFMASMDQTIVIASAAKLGDELKALESTSWVSTAYMLSLASFQPMYGKLSDIFGRKPCLLSAYVIFALGCIACGNAQTMGQLIAARLLAGVGGGGMSTIVSIIMSDVIDLRSRGTWQVWATGSAVGAPLGGFFADNIGWRWSFLLQAPLAMIPFFAVLKILQVPPTPGSHAPLQTKLQRIDFAGSGCLVLTLASLLTALDRGGNIGWDNTFTLTALACAIAAGVAFIVVECTFAREPVAPPRILSNPALLAPYICNLTSLGCSVATVFYVALYVQAVRGRTAAQAGATLLPSIIASVMGSLLGGAVIQRTGRFKRLTTGMYVVMVGGSTLIAFATGAAGWHSDLGLGVGLFMMSIGNGCGLTTTLVSLIAQAGSADQAVATAVSYLFRSLGSVLCLSVGSTIFQATLRRKLHATLEGADVDEIVRRVREALSYMDELDPHTSSVVRGAYEQSLQRTFDFCIFLSATAFLCSVWVREKPSAVG